MIYPEIGRLTKEILDRGRHIILCTNGMFIRKRLHEFKPTSSFFWNVHLDGLERTHDLCVERDGVFREAIEGIKAAKAAGFLVCSNTTIYKETDLNEIAELYAYLDELGVDGYMLSPAYGYSAVQTKEIFMSREDIREKFREACRAARQVQPDGFADLSGFPARRARTRLHGLGHAHVQSARLERALLLDHRRPPRDVQGTDREDALGKLRSRQRSALRGLHDARGL